MLPEEGKCSEKDKKREIQCRLDNIINTAPEDNTRDASTDAHMHLELKAQLNCRCRMHFRKHQSTHSVAGPSSFNHEPLQT